MNGQVKYNMVKYIKESLQRPEEIANELFWLNKDNVVLDFDLFLRNNLGWELCKQQNRRRDVRT